MIFSQTPEKTYIYAALSAMAVKATLNAIFLLPPKPHEISLQVRKKKN
jgi:hypothetical protein